MRLNQFSFYDEKISFYLRIFSQSIYPSFISFRIISGKFIIFKRLKKLVFSIRRTDVAHVTLLGSHRIGITTDGRTLRRLWELLPREPGLSEVFFDQSVSESLHFQYPMKSKSSFVSSIFCPRFMGNSL